MGFENKKWEHLEYKVENENWKQKQQESNREQSWNDKKEYMWPTLISLLSIYS